MGWPAALRALCFGAIPCLLLGCVVAVLGSYEEGPIPLSHDPPTQANVEARAAFLDRRLGTEFTVIPAPPFVLVAEEPADAAEAHAAMVGALVDRLRQRFFEHDPKHVIDIWLFASTDSYRRNTRAYLDDWPRTLQGYYAPRRHAVVVNLESGERTLRHELVHPFLDANFPGCPAWFNEGMASLYESDDSDEPDVRLRRLARALRQKQLPSLAALTVSTDREFYEDPQLMNYAHARYLLQFLDERGDLERYYAEFRETHAHDPTGYQTLLAVTHQPAPELQRDFGVFLLLERARQR